MTTLPISTRLHQRMPGWRLRETVRLWWCHLPFTSPLGLVESYTMIPRPRLIQLEASVRRIARRGIEGDVVECGCAEGGSSRFIVNCRSISMGKLDEIPARSRAGGCQDHGRAEKKPCPDGVALRRLNVVPTVSLDHDAEHHNPRFPRGQPAQGLFRHLFFV